MNKTAEYEFTDNIPKQKCFIKLNPNITVAQETQLVNGIRNVLTDRTVIVLQSSVVEQSLQSFKIIF